jgi:sigma-B regulation protein RsbU (phosphoserine phosphatase)
VQIAGYYQSATECGGDWWYHSVKGDKVYVWIGDVTGHGASAALLTSAARAVASVIDTGPERSPGECLKILNKAIQDISKGRMMMTFFIAVIDQRTGIMRYANASHEMPLLLRGEVAKSLLEDPRPRDFEPVLCPNNPRLGERVDLDFVEGELNLKSGDSIAFFTDGAIHVQNSSSVVYGERRFTKAVGRVFADQSAIGESIQHLKAEIDGFRSGASLADDITFVMVRFDQSAVEDRQAS